MILTYGKWLIATPDNIQVRPSMCIEFTYLLTYLCDVTMTSHYLAYTDSRAFENGSVASGFYALLISKDYRGDDATMTQGTMSLCGVRRLQEWYS